MCENRAPKPGVKHEPPPEGRRPATAVPLTPAAMSRILYVFPHPDDESFGPAPAIARQQREGHEVCLLTLTRGEATSQRERYGYSKAEMGDVRYREMQCVARVLGLADLTVLGFADGELAELDPRLLEDAVAAHVARVRPDVVVTYVAHGISAHPDHLTTHAVVKRVYCALRAEGAAYLRRLALFTLRDPGRPGRPPHLRGTPEDALDAVVTFTDDDRRRGEEALACYETYREVVEAHRPLDTVADGVCFVCFQERHRPPLADLTSGL